jgi:hypothetical protein
MTKIYSPKDTLSLQNKELYTFRRGRVSVAQEIRRQTNFRKRYESFIFKRLNTVFRRFLNTTLFLYTETGVYQSEVASNRLLEELEPVLLSFYRRVFLAMFQSNEGFYERFRKDDAMVFGRNMDIEIMVNEYFRTKTLILTGIAQRQANAIQKEIQKLRAEDLAIPIIARGIQEKFSNIFRNRARLIARTETHNVASFANHKYHSKVSENLGINMKKRWCAVNDTRTRSFHADANGQTVNMDGDFTVNGAPMQFAGDPKGGAKNVINCRCVILYVDENDIVT